MLSLAVVERNHLPTVPLGPGALLRHHLSNVLYRVPRVAAFCLGGVTVALRLELPGAHLEVCSICRERILLLLRAFICER